jgi:hypothetical protein
MTAKEQLRQRVETLTEREAARTLRLLDDLRDPLTKFLDEAAGIRATSPIRGSSRPSQQPSPSGGSAVKQYVVWNEPNLALWLQPQFDCAHGHCTPASPAIYRALFRSAAPAIRRADPGARVYAGALAPRGSRGRSRNASMAPLTFLRALGCVDRRLRRDRGRVLPPFLGVPMRTQSIWLQRGAHLAWRQPRVRTLSQYLWRDDPIRASAFQARARIEWVRTTNVPDLAGT